MTQPFPEPHYFDSEVGTVPTATPDLLEGRLGILAVLAAPEAHASGWAAQAAVALAEASQAAGRPTSLMDLALGAPQLHKAAGGAVGEGVSDVVLFGASPDRVSRWTPAGVRVLTAGTPVGDSQELVQPDSPEGDAGWLRAARSVVEVDGCVLAYVVADTPEAAAILHQVPDVILFRHEGEEVTALPSVPSMVLEPQPVSVSVEVPDVQALDDGALDASASHDDDSLEDLPLEDALFDDSASEAPPLEEAVLEDLVLEDLVREDVVTEDVAFEEATDTDDAVATEDVVALDLESAIEDAEVPEEVILDLDDVAGDSGLDTESILTADLQPDSSPADAGVNGDIVGLEGETAWPAFTEPLEVQDPGSVDPLITAGPQPVGDPKDAGLDDIVAGDTELSIVPDEGLLGRGPASDRDTDDVVAGGAMEGLVDSGLGTLDRIGEPSSHSADHVSGLHDPTGWGPPPEAGSAPDESPEPSTDPVEKKRREDPWGGPSEAEAPPIAPIPEPAKLDVPEAFPDEEAAEPLPWEVREAEGAATHDEEVPEATVTRTRTRTRAKGPRPFLLILFLLLVATVAVLWWTGLLDVPALDFLRGDAT